MPISSISLHAGVFFFSSVRVQFSSQAVFERSLLNEQSGDIETSEISGYFFTPSFIVTEAQPLDLCEIVSILNAHVSNFSKRGSGYSLVRISRLTISFVPYYPLGVGAGSSYIQTPQWLSVKNAVINVKNYDDDRCFQWAILSALFPAKCHSDRLSNYLPYEDSIDVSGLPFPLHPSKIPLFEKKNPTIAIHCLAYDSETKGFSVLYLSPEMHKRQHAITLLLLDSQPSNGFEKKHHYVYVKNLSRLVAHRDKHGHKRHVCLSCLQVFQSEQTLNKHSECCLMHKPQQTVFPDAHDPMQCKLKFRSHYQEFPFSFYLVADLESYLESTDEQNGNSERILNCHKTSGFCTHRVSAFDEYQTPPYTYSGTDTMERFYEHIFEEARIISDILARQTSMKPLSPHQQAAYDSTTTCQNCKSSFIADNPKTRHHCHVQTTRKRVIIVT